MRNPRENADPEDRPIVTHASLQPRFVVQRTRISWTKTDNSAILSQANQAV
jgi:hypothetical protein